VPDPTQRLELLRDVAVALHHEAEAAIRAWSLVDAAAARSQAKVDAARERAVADAYREVGVVDDIAEMLGQIGVAVLIGLQHRSARTDRVVMRQLFTLLQAMADVAYVPRRRP
jgi:hypothetical protein